MAGGRTGQGVWGRGGAAAFERRSGCFKFDCARALSLAAALAALQACTAADEVIGCSVDLLLPPEGGRGTLAGRRRLCGLCAALCTLAHCHLPPSPTLRACGPDYSTFYSFNFSGR